MSSGSGEPTGGGGQNLVPAPVLSEEKKAEIAQRKEAALQKKSQIAAQKEETAALDALRSALRSAPCEQLAPILSKFILDRKAKTSKKAEPPNLQAFPGDIHPNMIYVIGGLVLPQVKTFEQLIFLAVYAVRQGLNPCDLLRDLSGDLSQVISTATSDGRGDIQATNKETSQAVADLDRQKRKIFCHRYENPTKKYHEVPGVRCYFESLPDSFSRNNILIGRFFKIAEWFLDMFHYAEWLEGELARRGYFFNSRRRNGDGEGFLLFYLIMG